MRHLLIMLLVPACWLGGAAPAAAQPSGRQAATPTATLATPEPATPFAPDTVVATIDGEPLTLDELLVRYATLPQPVRDRYAARPGGLGEFLADVAANLAVVHQARRLGVADDPLYELLMKIRREEVLRDLYARRTVLSPVDEAALQQRYESGDWRREPAARVRHILVTPVAESPPANTESDDAVGAAAAREKIDRLRGQLSRGADFRDLARRFSEDASAPDGGDLGWVAPGELVPALSKAVFTLAAGETSGVVESSLGFHLAELVELRHGGKVPFAAVRELLYQQLVGERAADFGRSAHEDRDRVAGEHQIELFPERLPW